MEVGVNGVVVGEGAVFLTNDLLAQLVFNEIRVKLTGPDTHFPSL